MLENYSVEARCVVSQATVAARRLDHPRVGTEHLLLGLLSLGVLDVEGLACQVLRGLGVVRRS